MPYSSVKDLPSQTDKLSPKKKKQFLAAFNSAFAEHKSEETAFKIAWAAVNKEAVETEVVFKAADKPKQILYCVALEPDSEDLQEDVIDAGEIEKTAHDYLLNSRVVGNSHLKNTRGTIIPVDAGVVESFIAPVDYEVGGETIKKGSWVMAIKVYDTELWKSVEAGDITGISIGGVGERWQLD